MSAGTSTVRGVTPPWTWVAVALAALGLLGCGASVTFTPRAEPRTARPRCCDVRVVNGRAPRDWEVIGVLDLEAFSVRALPRDDEAFLRLVQPAVCEAGGDAVIAGIDGDGRYVLATVLAWTDEPTCPGDGPC